MEYVLGNALGNPAIVMSLWIGFMVVLLGAAFVCKWDRPLTEPPKPRPPPADGPARNVFEEVFLVGAAFLTIGAFAAILLLWTKGSPIDPRTLLEKGAG